MSVQILFRRGTAAQWTSANPILGNGEPGYETDTGRLKVGNGTDTWSILSYIEGEAGVADGNTTYSISAETATGGADIRLLGSDASTDSVRIAAGTNVTVTRTDANTITIASTATGGEGGATDLDGLTDVVILSPTSGQVLKYNGSFWVNDTDNAGGGALPSRSSLAGSTGSLANGASGPINLTGFRSYALMKIQTSAAAWVRIYTSEAARLADNARLQGEDPLPGAGVIAEVITTGAETVLISPGTIGFNDESPVTTNIPMRVTNLSGNTASITVTLTAIQLEA
jgi:hypothetical protein